ncbi:molybdopterin-binding oxidoreductase [bacterium]|nr:MAG: molybdopterin-binding oxidoreductase [bacterium]
MNPESELDLPNDEAEAQMSQMSRRSFLWAAVAGAGSLAGLRWIDTRRLDGGIPWPLRRVLDTQGEIARDLYSTARLAPTFPVSMAREPRANGDIGLGEDFDPSQWKLMVSGLYSGADLELTLAEIKKLPRTEIVTELKCIEGWSVIVHWAGVKVSDFMTKYPPATLSGEAPNLTKKPQDLMPYVGAQTPDGQYFVGLDIESVLHPQTLLCYEMNGKPLTLEHGAPLRLVTPTKYGIKHLKRLGSLQFTGIKPEDYWAQQGYDWYSGH